MLGAFFAIMSALCSRRLVIFVGENGYANAGRAGDDDDDDSTLNHHDRDDAGHDQELIALPSPQLLPSKLPLALLRPRETLQQNIIDLPSSCSSSTLRRRSTKNTVSGSACSFRACGPVWISGF